MPSLSAPMPQVDLQMRTYPVVRVDGRVAPLNLRRGLALLSILVEIGGKVARTRLSELLWPDVQPETGRGRLRRLAHETNQALGLALIVGDGDALWLSSEVAPIDADVDRVRRVARQVVTATAGAPSHVLLDQLLQPDAHQVLEGFELGADAFDEWVAQRRSEQHRLLARALQRAGEQLLAQGQPLLAAQAATRLVAIEPLADAGHALLLRAQSACGDLAAIESAYFAFAALLRDELGVRPSPAYEALYAQERTRVLQAAPEHGAGASVTPAMPAIRFADTDDGAVAYLEIGNGPDTLIVLFALWSHVKIAWDEPSIRAVLHRLARRFRVVLMDRRGVGVSERLTRDRSVPAGIADLDAVRRALGARRTWLFGNAVGSMIAIEYAASNRDAVSGLVLYAANARGAWAPDYPWAPTGEQLEVWAQRLHADWGHPTSLAAFAPSQADDPAVRAWWARLMRQAMSRNSLPTLLREFGRMDVRHHLPRVRVPTLVLQRAGDRIVRSGAARFLADHIAGARLKLLPGDDHNLWAGDVDLVIGEIERFVDEIGG